MPRSVSLDPERNHRVEPRSRAGNKQATTATPTSTTTMVNQGYA